MRRAVERLADKYDTHLTRLGNASRTKSPYEVRDEMFQADEMRRAYFGQLFEYVARMNGFKWSIDNVIVEKVGCEGCC